MNGTYRVVSGGRLADANALRPPYATANGSIATTGGSWASSSPTPSAFDTTSPLAERAAVSQTSPAGQTEAATAAMAGFW